MDISPSAPFEAQPPRSAGLPNAKDMSHHINRVTRNRQASSLKELYKYMSIPGMVLCAGGIPSPALFPFETLSATVLPPDHLPLDPPRVPVKAKSSLFSWLFGSSNLSFSIPKYAENPKDPMAVSLATSLQYQSAVGTPPWPVFLRKYVEEMTKPAYADWDVILDVGATDGWAKCCQMLLELGDSILVEEWTYPGAMNAYLPYETNVVALKMDGEGIIPSYMDQVLANWDESKGRRPRVLYTIPTGQNPTGATCLAKRKQAVYEIACKYDIIIVEDEPYYALYVGDYYPPGKTATPLVQNRIDLERQEGAAGNAAFISSLPPSYLTFDKEGRVIRLDTFSKTSCPGSRLGWITASPIFIERLTRISECGTQAPSGFATSMTMMLMNTWGWDGEVRWLRGIKATYRMRRDWMCDALTNAFHVESDDTSMTGGANPLVLDVATFGRGFTAYAKHAEGSSAATWDEKRGVTTGGRKPLFSFIPPTSGMFVFLAVHLDQHPDFAALGGNDDATNVLMDKLWRELAEHLVLFAPGVTFDAGGVHNIGGQGVGYFRVSYSIITYEQANTAVKTFAKVLTKFLHAE